MHYELFDKLLTHIFKIATQIRKPGQRYNTKGRHIEIMKLIDL